MLDIKRIRENAGEIRDGVINKGTDPSAVEEVLRLDRDRRTHLTEVEALKSHRNKTSKEIGLLKKDGKDTSVIEATMREVGEKIGKLDQEVRNINEKLGELLLSIPNVPHSSVPVGSDESDNKVVRTWGEAAKFDFQPKDHITLGEQLGIIDMARATRLSAPGFPLLLGNGSRLQRALIQFMLDVHVEEHGYKEVWPPVLCNRGAMTGTGQLPKMAEDMYYAPADDLYLAPTAEVPVTNIYREEIIEQPLPIYLTAYSACFRREAGAAGKETRGLIRVHQFDKVEMVKFVDPDTSYDELESLLANAEDILQRLGLHYRVLELCTGDISFAAAKCYDLELWAPGQNTWLEVSSCSNFEDFQARRAAIRYRTNDNKVSFLHTLNGSGVALPRLMVAILENGQQQDGSIVLPDAIVPYMRGISRIEPAAETG
ncbi:MAG: serine--tRNA ligase [Kiritimatiellia bacterium]|jgi:seryl-tRNA synthetase|nr:serine--tRNA ligase [Kiritimatiellia bacterium]